MPCKVSIVTLWSINKSLTSSKKKQCQTPHQCVLCLTPATCTREPLSIPDEKYCHKRKWRRTRGFGDNLDDFLAEILYSEGLEFKPCSRSIFINRINSKFVKRGKKEYAFSVDKKTHNRKIRLCT